MSIKLRIKNKTMEILGVYWLLVRIIVPISIVVELLRRLGVIAVIAPIFAPLMNLVGLPPELGLAWLTAMIVGIWGAVPLIFTLVPVSSLSVADVTVFSALVLFAHGLPVEQKIIQKAGPGIIITATLRILGGLIYALLLHSLLTHTSWLSTPVNPVWVPTGATPNWSEYFVSLSESMAWILVVLVGLSWCIDILRVSGVLKWMMSFLTPVLRLSGIHREAGHLTVVGLFLGISYGAGLIIQEIRSGEISARQVFLSSVFMGFAHSVIEDTIVFIALGADLYGVLFGRIVFAVTVTGVLSILLQRLPDKIFYAYLFSMKDHLSQKNRI